MSDLEAKLQKAIFDIQKIAHNGPNMFQALNEIGKICAQLQKAGDLSPRSQSAKEVAK